MGKEWWISCSLDHLYTCICCVYVYIIYIHIYIQMYIYIYIQLYIFNAPKIRVQHQATEKLLGHPSKVESATSQQPDIQ